MQGGRGVYRGEGGVPFVDRAAAISRLRELETVPLSFKTFITWGKAQWSLYSEKKKLIQESGKIVNATIDETSLTPAEKQSLKNFTKALLQTLPPSDLESIQPLIQTKEGLALLFSIPKGFGANESKKAFVERLRFTSEHLDELNEVFAFYEPALSKEDKGPFQAFLGTREGLEYLKQIRSLAKEGDSIRDIVKHIATGMRNHPKEMPGLALRTLSTFDDVQRMMGRRFAEGDAFKYLTSWLSATTTHNQNFMPTKISSYITKFENYVRGVKEIQNARPNIYVLQNVPGTFMGLERGELLGDPFFIECQSFLQPIINNLDTETFVANNQLIEQTIYAHYLTREPGHRNIPSLSPINPGADPYTLMYEIHPSPGMIHTTDSATQIEFRSKSELHISNAKTGETRTLLKPLPYEGSMTETEMRRYSDFLREVVNNPTKERAEQRYPPELNQEDMGLCTSLFLDWVDDLDQDQGRLSFDFNATETRPAFTYAREMPETKKALENPQSAELAIDAAKMQNIYLSQEGRRSLLPPELPGHKGIAEIDPQELQEAQELFVKSEIPGTAKIALPVRKDGKVEMEEGTVGFDYSWVTQNLPADTLGVEVKTTLKCGGKENSRTTLYLYPKGQERQAALQNVADTGLLHSALLLAKAEYLAVAFPREPTHIDETLNVFKEAAKSQGFPSPFIDETARRYIQPVAEQLGKERANELRDFVNTREGLSFIRHLIIARIQPQDRTNMILLAMENPQVLNAMNLMFEKKEPHAERVLSLYARTERILGSRLTEQTHLETFKAFQSLASQENANTLLDHLDDFLTQAEAVHALRPRVVHESDLELDQLAYAFLNLQNALFPLSARHPEIPQFFINISSKITETCYVNNTQPISDNIRAYLLPLFSPRTAPLLEAEDVYSLKTESHPDLFLQQDSPQPIGSDLYSTYHITNPKTMETRTMRQRLPLTADMTHTEARKRLSILDKTIEESKYGFNDEAFEQAYNESELPQNNKEETRAQCKEFIRKGKQLLAEVMLDFNGTQARPAFAFAREEANTKDALEHPDSQEAAVKAATQLNIYQFQGKLALLPPEIASNHPEVATLSAEELAGAKQQQPTPLQLPGGDGIISCVTEEIDTEVAMKEFAVTKLTTTITRGNATISRETYYYRDQFNEIVNSPLFERDLLLAKASFMNKFSLG